MIFARPTQEQALALAAVFQACELVADLAHNGQTDNAKLEMAMGALLNQNPESLDQLYGPVDNLTTGINSMADFMGRQSSNPHHPEVMRYVISILYLARKLSGNKAMLAKIAQALRVLRDRHSIFLLPMTMYLAILPRCISLPLAPCACAFRSVAPVSICSSRP